MTRLVERIDRELEVLRLTQSLGPETFGILRLAASRREADAKRIAELEGVLKPFSQLGELVEQYKKRNPGRALSPHAELFLAAKAVLPPKAKDGSR